MDLQIPDVPLGSDRRGDITDWKAEPKVRPHVIDACKFGTGRWTRCSCGELLDGFRSDQEMADAYGVHTGRILGDLRRTGRASR